MAELDAQPCNLHCVAPGGLGSHGPAHRQCTQPLWHAVHGARVPQVQSPGDLEAPQLQGRRSSQVPRMGTGTPRAQRAEHTDVNTPLLTAQLPGEVATSCSAGPLKRQQGGGMHTWAAACTLRPPCSCSAPVTLPAVLWTALSALWHRLQRWCPQAPSRRWHARLGGSMHTSAKLAPFWHLLLFLLRCGLHFLRCATGCSTDTLP